MDNAKDSELIDRFLKEKLSEEERAAFNRRMNRDEAFAQAVAERLSMREALQDMRREEITSILRETAPERKPFWKRPAVYIGAAILIGLALFFLFGPFRKPELSEAERKQAIVVWKQQEELVLNTAGGGPADWAGMIARDSLDRALQVLDRLRSEYPAPCSEPYLDYFAGLLQLYHAQDYRRAEISLGCALGESGAAGYRPDVPKHLAISKALRGKAGEARALLERYDISPDALPTSIQAYLSI